MRSAVSSGRGVGTGLLGMRPRGRTGAGAMLCAALLLVGPAAGAAASLTPVPQRHASALGAGGGSDRISALIRQMRILQARIDTAQVGIDTLELQRDQVAVELDEALQRRSALKEQVAGARTDLAAAEKDLRTAKSRYRKAKKAKSSAAKELAAAQRALDEAQEDLDSAADAADTAAASARRAEKRVVKAKSGTKARRSAFASWQMAAIQDLAAHARHDLADDRATDEYVGLQAAEAALTTATYDKRQRAAARRAAIAGAEQAQEEVDALVAQRTRVKAIVAQLRAEDAELADQRRAARASVKKLQSRLAAIEARAAEVEVTLAGKPAPKKPKDEAEDSEKGADS